MNLGISQDCSFEVGDVSLSCRGKHVKPLVLHLIFFQSCLIAIPSGYERKGIQSTLVFAHMLVRYKMSPTTSHLIVEIGRWSKFGLEEDSY